MANFLRRSKRTKQRALTAMAFAMRAATKVKYLPQHFANDTKQTKVSNG